MGRPVKTGLEDWLSAYGLSYGKGLVLDTQSGALPIPVQRNVGGYSVQEIELANYPYIVDVRNRGLSTASPITAGLGQIDVPWASPIIVAAQTPAQNTRKATELLRSSERSWLSDSNDLMPDYDSHPDMGFAAGKPSGPQTLAVMVEGGFDSLFKGKPSPLLPAAAAPALDRVIQHSPDSARLIMLGSSAMLSDQAIRLVGEALGSNYTKPTEFVQNMVEWSLEDQGLLSIRGREHFARTLMPMTRNAQAFWEYLNYGAALGGLAIIWLFNRRRRHLVTLRHLKLLEQV
jgi:ABC-2 type transport system permease protein